jgi:hypothetical protein
VGSGADKFKLVTVSRLAQPKLKQIVPRINSHSLRNQAIALKSPARGMSPRFHPTRLSEVQSVGAVNVPGNPQRTLLGTSHGLLAPEGSFSV